MTATAHRFHSIEADGPWTSPPFPAAERRHIVQGVIGGYLMGRPRWATDLDGNFIYGLDAKGKEMKSAPAYAPSLSRKRQHATKQRMTMADIKHAAKSAGSPYFDRGSVRFFGGDTNSGPYVGTGGIYFAQSNNAGHRVKHVTLEPFRINTVQEAASHTAAREQAKVLARSSSQHHATKALKNKPISTEPKRATKKSLLPASHSEWKLGHIEHHGDCSITFHADYGRGHYQVRCAGKGHVGSPKTLSEARSIARLQGEGARGSARHATKKSPAQLQREIDEVIARPSGTQPLLRGPGLWHDRTREAREQIRKERGASSKSRGSHSTVKCPSPDHPLYPELRHIRQVAHDTGYAASQLAQEAERAFRSGDCEKAAEYLEAAKRVIAKERRKKPKKR